MNDIWMPQTTGQINERAQAGGSVPLATLRQRLPRRVARTPQRPRPGRPPSRRGRGTGGAGPRCRPSPDMSRGARASGSVTRSTRVRPGHRSPPALDAPEGSVKAEFEAWVDGQARYFAEYGKFGLNADDEAAATAPPGLVIPLESVALATCLAILLAGCHPAQSSPGAETLTVTHVADGDTLTGLDGAGQHVRVRLLGVDAPEVAHDGRPGECGATDARNSLERLVLHQRVTLADDPRADRIDRYGRRLAYVDVGGVDVALRQLEVRLRGRLVPTKRSPARTPGELPGCRAGGAQGSCWRVGQLSQSWTLTWRGSGWHYLVRGYE